ncbi:hypothetical protein, partial [Limosilactobacillus fermentum]|uniref:hypothetical protein n=1 Tax=Limosilactobacillus fermentum TaxID=1613 RepID=UPI001E52F904
VLSPVKLTLIKTKTQFFLSGTVPGGRWELSDDRYRQRSPSSHQRIPTSGGQHQARTRQFEPLKLEYNELEHLARQIDQALATIPFTDRQEAKRLIEEY